MSKKVGAGCAFSVVGIACLLGFIFWATSGAVAVADLFIDNIRQGKLDDAYGLLGPQVTKELPRDKFEVFLEQSQLKMAESASWSSRSVENGEGTVKGDVKLSTGDSLSLSLFLSKVDGDWKIKGLDIPKQSSSPSPSTAIDPEHEKVAQEFFQLLKAEKFAEAYDLCGEMLKKDADLAKFETMAKQVGLTNHKSLSLKESQPREVGPNLTGTLTLANDDIMDIELTLQDVEGKWLVQGFNFRNRSQFSLDKPNQENATKLAQGILKGIDSHMDSGNIEPLASLCHSVFANKLKSENVLDPFLKNFGEPAHFRSFLNEAIVLTAEPMVLGNGALALKGRTKVNEKKEHLYFELIYLPESKKWALEKMDLWVRGPGDLPPEPEVSF